MVFVGEDVEAARVVPDDGVQSVVQAHVPVLHLLHHGLQDDDVAQGRDAELEQVHLVQDHVGVEEEVAVLEWRGRQQHRLRSGRPISRLIGYTCVQCFASCVDVVPHVVLAHDSEDLQWTVRHHTDICDE